MITITISELNTFGNFLSHNIQFFNQDSVRLKIGAMKIRKTVAVTYTCIELRRPSMTACLCGNFSSPTHNCPRQRAALSLLCG